MALSISAVKSIILSMIGGNVLMPVPTVTIAGAPAVSQMGLGTLTSLASAATSIAGTVGTMSSVLQNPVGGVIETVSGTLDTLTSNNFSQLDTELTDYVANDPALSDSYANLKTALGGGDGTSGFNSELSKFKKHTDKISGVTVAADSTLSKPLTVPPTPGGR